MGGYRVSKCDVIKFSFLHFSIFHDHISVEHDKTLTHQILLESVYGGQEDDRMNT